MACRQKGAVSSGRCEGSGAGAVLPAHFQGDETTLVHWKPLQNGGELTLDAEWQAIPALFSRLAQQDVEIAAFAIAPQGRALRLQLELEHAK